MDWETRLIHSGFDIEEHTGAVSIPIYQASTYRQTSVDEAARYEYGRSGNPTRNALEGTMAVLEGGSHGFAFSSGMAAISSALSLLKTGEHILVCRDVYGGTYRALTALFSRFGISNTFVDTTDILAIRAAIRPDTKALFLETPSNPLLRITDLRACVNLAREHGLFTIADNTFMTPYLQRPLELGVDVVVHSATKFLGGHSDVIAGVAVTANEQLAGTLRMIQTTFGAVLGPLDSWLVSRGIKTLKVRMDAQQETAGKLAEWLAANPLVKQVHYPGLAKHPGRDTHSSQSGGFGCVLSFTLADGVQARKFLKCVRIPILAVSLGGVESILTYPVTMSHASMPRECREELNVRDSLVRLSVGLEALADLKEGLDRALRESVTD
ncbi:MAG: PLP-dependent transferase [Clostridiales bacterium]|jgi:cystathionine beta-lyase/cystathionine gamma-synthase|nr:PLP-dependent transferase [Clostridiales bacterium]